MSEFQKWTSQHRTIRASRDWNALLDHGLEKPASYIIRKNGSYVEAINGSTGKIDFGGQNNAGGVSGSDAATVIQQSLNAMTNGGEIFIKEGDYLLDEKITLPRLEDSGPPRRSIKIRGSGLGTHLIPSSRFTDNVVIDLPPVSAVEAVYGYELADFTLIDSNGMLASGDYVLLRDIRNSRISIRIVGSGYDKSTNGLRVLAPTGASNLNRVKCWISNVNKAIVLGDAADLDAVALTDLTGCWLSACQYGLDLVKREDGPAGERTANYAHQMLLDDIYTRAMRIATKDNVFKNIWFEDPMVVEFTETSENNRVENIASAGGIRRCHILGGKNNVVVDKFLDEIVEIVFSGYVHGYFGTGTIGTGSTRIAGRALFLETGGASGGRGLAYSGNNCFWHMSWPWLTFKAKLDQLTQQTVELGFQYDDDNYLMFIHDAGADNVNWKAKSVRVGVVEGETDTGVTGNTEIHEFSITICGDDRKTIRYFIDGGLVATHTLSDVLNFYQILFRITNKEDANKCVRIYFVRAVQGGI